MYEKEIHEMYPTIPQDGNVVTGMFLTNIYIAFKFEPNRVFL